MRRSIGFVEELVSDVVESQCPADVFPEEWDLESLFTALLEIYPVHVSREQAEQAADSDELAELFVDDALARYEEKERAVTPEVMRELERVVLLNIIDTKWREHLYEMDYLQEGIHLRALAQQDPITAYRREAYDMFQALTDSIRADLVRYIYRVEFVRQDEEQPRPQASQPTRIQDNRAAVEEGGGQRARRRRHREREPSRERQGAAERAVPLRQRQEVQEVPRRLGLRASLRPRLLDRPSQQLAGVLGPPDVQFRDRHEPAGEIERSGLRHTPVRGRRRGPRGS